MKSLLQLTLVPGQGDQLVLDLQGSGKLSSADQKGLRDSKFWLCLGLSELVAPWLWFS